MILEAIVARKRAELKEKQRLFPLSALKVRAAAAPATRDFAGAIGQSKIRLIAEVKLASPSRGDIAPGRDPVDLAREYAAAGTAAISVLTETHYFRGSPDYLKHIQDALAATDIPLLRKDFLTDPYEIYESRAMGADALLLIAAILPSWQLKELRELSQELGMDCLVEVHSEKEIELALTSGAAVIGINNRDLTTFSVDIATTERLRSFIPAGRIVVSESGIRTRADILKLTSLGVNAVLIGEALVAAPDSRLKIKELFGDPD